MKQEIEHLIIRQLTGEATDRDTVDLSQWMAEDKANREAYLKYAAYFRTKVSTTAWDKDAAYEKLAARIAQPKRRMTNILRRTTYISAAAIVALIAGIGLFYLMKENAAGGTEHYSYLSGNAITAVSLPDGTEVSLNKNSRLTYSSAYGKDKREVSLEGEAYFRVVRDEKKEFAVSLGENRIIVSGTSFDVNYLPKENVLTATLIEGAIRFKAQDQEVALKPSQHLSYNSLDHKLSISMVESEIISAWKDNLIRYKSISFGEFTRMLEKQYGVEITISDRDLCTNSVSGTFDASLSVEQILDIMQKSLSYTYKKDNNKYMITIQP